MDWYPALKHLHMSCAWLSITGFALRSYWMLRGSALLQHRLSKVLPHIVDTVLLASAIAMLFQLGLWPTQPPWLFAKLVALLVYIGLGMVALRFGRTAGIRAGAAAGALLTASYILGVAYSKSALGPLALL